MIEFLKSLLVKATYRIGYEAGYKAGIEDAVGYLNDVAIMLDGLTISDPHGLIKQIAKDVGDL